MFLTFATAMESELNEVFPTNFGVVLVFPVVLIIRGIVSFQLSFF